MQRLAGTDTTPLESNRIMVVDLDRDNDLDLLFTSEGSKGWFENMDGQGNFERHLFSFALVESFFKMIDFDADGDLDFIDYDVRDDAIVWYANLGDNTFSQKQTLVDHAGVATKNGMIAEDLDGDNDIDLIVNLKNSDKAVRFENLSDIGEFVQHDESLSPAAEYAWIDLDNDGNREFVTASRFEFRYYRPDHTLAQTLNLRFSDDAPSIQVVDTNMDGQSEVIVNGSWLFEFDGNRFSRLELPLGNRPHHVVADDFDQDGDTDFFDGRTLLIQRPIGDANGDGTFDSADLVMVFQAAEFEDDLTGNSIFQEGDWNNDGDFTTSDLVFAFQQGNYAVESRSAKPIWELTRRPN